ncbi:glycosyltransferase [Frankia sp. R82]|uniref:glycosyltransferase n=1 Tax=Frankia sp. R82 TaxID=2950553 RepID=UPI002044368B|nr:glycosyltransferase [Frankia sp. R82]MCM3884730.1 glycosyltransferase [Frankia sp. R82]
MSRPSPPDRIGVVIPARDEQQLIGPCLDAVATAAAHPGVAGIPVTVLVVLDCCRDATAARCRARATPTLGVELRNVGAVRRAGFAALIGNDGLETARPAGGGPGPDAVSGSGSGPGGGALWLATTDADTRVAPDWLTVQLRLARAGADAVLGIVTVDDWNELPATLPARYRAGYVRLDGAERSHPHVHGANMAVSAAAYLRAGGMPGLPVGEDHALATRLAALPGVSVVSSTALRATTSARARSRVQGGFADHLRALALPRTGPPVRTDGRPVAEADPVTR